MHVANSWEKIIVLELKVFLKLLLGSFETSSWCHEVHLWLFFEQMFEKSGIDPNVWHVLALNKNEWRKLIYSIKIF